MLPQEMPLYCSYSSFSKGRQGPEVFSKQRGKDEFNASRNRTGGAESHQLLDYDSLWSFAGQALHEGIDTSAFLCRSLGWDYLVGWFFFFIMCLLIKRSYSPVSYFLL